MIKPRFREGMISELYSAIQGEGLFVGERQILVRFFGCGLGCLYCDTPDHLFKKGQARVEQKAGARDFVLVEGKVSSEVLADYCGRLNSPKGLHHSIALTGGEPLEQADFLKAFIPLAKEATALPIFLETGGVLYKELIKLRGLVDIVSMDIKLPSATGLRSFWREHEKFLDEANAFSQVYAKMVLNQRTPLEEIEAAGQMVAEISDEIPVILQPEMGINRESDTVLPEKLLIFQERLKRELKKVLVIPQTHKMMDQL